MSKIYLAFFAFLVLLSQSSNAWAAQYDFDANVDIQSISIQPPTFFAGEPVRLYGHITNEGNKDISGYLAFFQGQQELGTEQPFSMRAGGDAEDVWVDWTPVAGTYNVSIRILQTSPQDQNPGNDTSFSPMMTVTERPAPTPPPPPPAPVVTTPSNSGGTTNTTGATGSGSSGNTSSSSGSSSSGGSGSTSSSGSSSSSSGNGNNGNSANGTSDSQSSSGSRAGSVLGFSVKKSSDSASTTGSNGAIGDGSTLNSQGDLSLNSSSNSSDTAGAVPTRAPPLHTQAIVGH